MWFLFYSHFCWRQTFTFQFARSKCFNSIIQINSFQIHFSRFSRFMHCETNELETIEERKKHSILGGVSILSILNSVAHNRLSIQHSKSIPNHIQICDEFELKIHFFFSTFWQSDHYANGSPNVHMILFKKRRKKKKKKKKLRPPKNQVSRPHTSRNEISNQWILNRVQHK